MFIKNYEFRYGDLDKNKNVKVSALIDLLQDISIVHTAKAGVNIDENSSNNIAWLLEGWRIRLDNPIDYAKPVTVKTGITKMEKIGATRKYEIIQNEQTKVTATSVWYTIDTEKRRIIRVPDEYYTAYESINEEDNNFPYLKLRSVENPEFVRETKIEKRDLDSNNHLNNMKSVEIALNSLPDDFEIAELQIKYRKELMLDEIVKIYHKKTENGYYAEFRNENNEICVLFYAQK